MMAEAYLNPTCPVPLDADELREAVLTLLLRRSPTPLVKLVGNKAYVAGVTDLWELMQSPTFMRQLGYGALEVVSLHLCPELKGMFAALEPVRGL
jgi:sorting nexin-13